MKFSFAQEHCAAGDCELTTLELQRGSRNMQKPLGWPGYTKGRLVLLRSGMTQDSSVDAAGLTAGERDYIQRELDMFFSSLPTVAEGFQLKTWRGGVKAGQPKVPPAGQSMLDRGLMRLVIERRPPRLLFTEAELAALRIMMSDRRQADPKKFMHIRQELGLNE